MQINTKNMNELIKFQNIEYTCHERTLITQFFFWMLIHGRIITPIKLYLKNESSFLKCKYVDYMPMAFISVHLDDSSRKNRPCIFIINHECHSISYAFSVIVTFVSNLQKIQKQKQSFLLLLKRIKSCQIVSNESICKRKNVSFILVNLWFLLWFNVYTC